MKLDWEIEYGLLKARVGDVEYRVRQESDEAWQANKRTELPRGHAIARCSIEGPLGTMSLANAVAWCERDAECPAQPAADECLEKETSGKMSGKMSSFPGTMDAAVWDLEFFHGFGLGREMAPGSMVEWFQAALSHGFREGQASVYELVDRAQGRRDCFGPKTSSPIDSFDARVWAEELRKAVGATDGRKTFAVSLELMETWFANALVRGYDERRSKETGWQKFSRDMYAKFLEKNPLPGFGYEEAPAVKSDLGAAVAFLTKRVGDLEAVVVGEQGRTMEMSVDLKGALDRLARLEART